MPIHRPQERLIQVRFLTDLMRIIAPLPGVQGHFEQTMIVAAVVLGELEGRPFQTSKLSEFLNMPRPTLLRRLHALCEDGIIERKRGLYFTVHERVNGPELIALTERVSKLILATADKLQHLKEG